VVCSLIELKKASKEVFAPLKSLVVPMFKPRACQHRDKARVQMPAKKLPQLKVKCKLFMGPTLGFDTKQRNSFLIKFSVFYN
jgi:hypothetical protein